MKHIRLDYLINGLFFIGEIIMQKHLYKFKKSSGQKGGSGTAQKYGARSFQERGIKKYPSNQKFYNQL